MSVADVLLIVMWIAGMVPAFFVTLMCETCDTPGERFSQVAFVVLWPAAVIVGGAYVGLAYMFGWENG